jgi:hypothetical protein
MTKQWIYIGFTAFLLNALSPAHAKWVLISQDTVGNSYYFEDTKIVKDPLEEQVSTWLLTSYTQALLAPNGEPTLSVIQDLSYYCRTGYESYKQFYIGYYAGPGGSGTSLGGENTENSAWERVIPETMSYLLFEFFCRPSAQSSSQGAKP